MYRATNGAAREKTGDKRERTGPSRTLLFVGPRDFVSESLTDAIERELNWIAVEQVETMADACLEFEYPVSLILLDMSLLRDADAFAFELGRAHPAALTAVIQDQAPRPSVVSEILASRCVRGVLPMNLKLDVWLSIIRLMLRGGEYFPMTLFQSYGGAPPASEGLRPPGTLRPGIGSDFPSLTDRESQILELVSQGSQNKVIAATLQLSEHTVKIHLHNIIKKLGVHNRTEAAALFHRRIELRNANQTQRPA